jgi:hypothetical protein
MESIMEILLDQSSNRRKTGRSHRYFIQQEEFQRITSMLCPASDTEHVLKVVVPVELDPFEE